MFYSRGRPDLTTVHRYWCMGTCYPVDYDKQVFLSNCFKILATWLIQYIGIFKPTWNADTASLICGCGKKPVVTMWSSLEIFSVGTNRIKCMGYFVWNKPNMNIKLVAYSIVPYFGWLFVSNCHEIHSPLIKNM